MLVVNFHLWAVLSGQLAVYSVHGISGFGRLLSNQTFASEDFCLKELGLADYFQLNWGSDNLCPRDPVG